MIACQRLARLELEHMPPAVLAAVVIAREQERVRHLAAEAPRHVNELREPNDGGPGQRQPLGPNDTIRVSLHDLGFAIDQETERATHGDHGQRLVGRVKSETTYDHEASWQEVRLQSYE